MSDDRVALGLAALGKVQEAQYRERYPAPLPRGGEIHRKALHKIAFKAGAHAAAQRMRGQTPITASAFHDRIKGTTTFQALITGELAPIIEGAFAAGEAAMNALIAEEARRC